MEKYRQLKARRHFYETGISTNDNGTCSDKSAPGIVSQSSNYCKTDCDSISPYVIKLHRTDTLLIWMTPYTYVSAKKIVVL